VGQVRDLSEALWTGQKSTAEVHPVTTILGLEVIDEGLAFLATFGNVTALDTSEGLVLIDTGSFFLAQANFHEIRAWTQKPLVVAVYTHGHVDHAFGVPPFDTEASERGFARAEVIAHEAVIHRFERYELTRGYNEHINRRQFGDATWPRDYRYPDRSYRDAHAFTVGGERIELHHDRGETDDHTWAFLPERKALCTGDLFIWASPNCGNPQKVQRYPREWAKALRKMEKLGAESLFPGHGPPIFGKDRIEQALRESAELLETLHDQTLELMNSGARLDEVLHAVKAPAHLLARPYLRPVYDEPEFIVRNLWRLYGGWYDGNPANLKPARETDLARELSELSGGALRLAERARELARQGELRLACHLAEYARLAAPADEAVKTLCADVYERRVESETSLMAKGVYSAAARGR
jgi:alkyl sulfatase BDS1-like metallo-beta-lactamase superfamily hydrolase